MADKQTPQKNRDIDCFVCFSSKVTSFKLCGRKLLNENFKSKLVSLLDHDSKYDKLIQKDAAVCRNCYNQINKVSCFLEKLCHSCDTLTNAPTSFKRCALSPLTPKSVNVNFDAKTKPVQRSSRKQLKLLTSTKDPQVNDVDICSPVPIQGNGKHTENGALDLHVSECKENTANTELDLSECATTSIPDHTYSKLKSAIKPGYNDDILEAIKESSNRSLDNVTGGILKDIKNQAATLTSRTTMLASVLYKYRDISTLSDNADNLLADIVKEMHQRIPFLFDVLCCVAIPSSGKILSGIIPVLASCYSILMKHRYHNLSAFHRLTTTIVTKGGLDERAQTRMNHLGLVLSSERRLRLQDSAQEKTSKLLTENLKSQSLVKITGDNLDIYVKTSNLGIENRNKDLHLFTSNVLFSRVATIDMCNESPKTDLCKIPAEEMLLKNNELQKEKLVHAYCILLGRILCKLPVFQIFRNIIPNHIPHEFMAKMSERSIVLPLPIQFKNEAKHEDCLSIMDSYEDQLTQIYRGAFGNIDLLRRYKVPLGGDQLTRVRLQEARNLRTLSITPEKRFDDLTPIVCEMWHCKQDFLEKCYKTLYKADNTPGTLNFFKTILHRTDVNGKVKGRFKPHYDLLMAVGEALVKEQFLEFFNMANESSKPEHHYFAHLEDDSLSEEEKRDLVFNILSEFIKKYGYGMVDAPENFHVVEPQYIQKLEAVILDGKLAFKQFLEPVASESDELFNYSMQLCHWYLQLLELSDTAKEGDMNRLILNCKYNLPFFYSHSKLSKYLVENIDFVLKSEYLLSPLQRMRVLEGAFVNIHGGKGRNVESDLVQEHSVCNQKSLIKTLGANKSEKAISRVTSAADTFANICSKFDESVQIKPKSGRHSKPISEQDQNVIYKQLRKLRPFLHSPGRKLKGFSNIKAMPLAEPDLPEFYARINQIISRLARSLSVSVDVEEEEDINEIDDNLPEL